MSMGKKKPSGKFVLRIPSSLHEQFQKEAHSREISLNQLVNEKLQITAPYQKEIAMIQNIFADELLGVVLFGSYASGEQTAQSDIDLLIVLRSTTTIHRQLYKIWDEQIESRIDAKFAPQFVQIPDLNSQVSSLWLEASLNGEVLYDTQNCIRKTISGIKQKIASGAYLRKTSHGHPYWIQAGAVNANKSLARDYITRARKRLTVLDALLKEEAWTDVVRESQVVIELALKGLLRHCHIEVPRIHDVSGVMLSEKDKLPQEVQKNLNKYVHISKTLRRDRELAFYGSEDLTPEEFYTQSDANEASQSAKWVVQSLLPLV